MNCNSFSALTGMRCEPQPTPDGSECIAVVTPFRLFDGEAVCLYAQAHQDGVHLFDDGQTMFWLHGIGHRGLEDRRAWRPLRTAVGKYSVTLNDDATIETFVRTGEAPLAFARMVSAILAIDAWARENAGAGASLHLADEAALYLRAWRPEQAVIAEPEPVIGFSGAEHRFTLQQGDEYIDTIGPSQQASSAELRKLVDVRASAKHAALDIRVVVDDRRQPERAQQEIAILGRVARAWPMSRLIEVSGQASRMQ